MQGWIKLHRKLLENPIFSDPYLLKLWIYCLLKATHKETDQIVGKQIVKLKPGQFVTGRLALAQDFNQGLKPKDIVSDRTIWRWMKLLESGGFLSINSTTKYSIITINNWCKYQFDDQQMTGKRPTNDQQMSTNKNEKNDKNEKNVVVDEVPPANYEQVIIQKYMQLAAIPGFDIPEIDKFAIRQVFNEGVPLDDALSLLEQCFRDFKPKHARDKINSFRYCATYILNKYFQKKEGVNNVYPIYRRSNGQTKGESQSKPDPIFGDFVGRLPRKSTPL